MSWKLFWIVWPVDLLSKLQDPRIPAIWEKPAKFAWRVFLMWSPVKTYCTDCQWIRFERYPFLYSRLTTPSTDSIRSKSLAIHVDRAIKGKHVVQVMERLRLFTERGPARIQVDNGSEFISKDLDKWAYENEVTLDFSRPGKPTDNALIESFNGSFRDECPNTNWFLSIDDARKKVDAWRRDYKGFRPHSSLGNLPRNSAGNNASEARNPYIWSVQVTGETQPCSGGR